MSKIMKIFRFVCSTVLGACMVGHSLSCTHLIETHAINHFMSAMENRDLDELRSVTSAGFEQKALRLDGSMQDLKLLKLPPGKAEVLRVEEVDSEENAATEKNVTVQVGKSKRKLKYRLIKEPKSRKWVVDDVYMKQTRSGLTATKSVTEQMNLLLAVREFLAAWRDGAPDEIVAMTSEKLAGELRELPADYLTWLARKTVGKKLMNSQLRPRAQMDADIAIVHVPASTGELTLSFGLEEDRWKVSDVSVTSQSSSGRISSVRDVAKVIAVVVKFLDSYEAADKQALAALSTELFYRGTLMPSDLSSIELPSSHLSEDEFEVDVQGKYSDFIIMGETQWLKITLLNDDKVDDGKTPDCLVTGVTIYELKSREEKSLSALLTSRAMVELFSQALINRDLKQLSHSSTPDFNRRVWDRLNEQSVRELYLEGVEAVPPRIISMDFHGVVSEVWVTQGQRALSYVLHDHDGRLLIHDVHVSGTEDRPSSLKTRLELMIPVWNFVRGIQSGDLKLIQRYSSKDFNQLVWQQVSAVPRISDPLSRHLSSSLTAVEMSEEQVVLLLGDDTCGARVSLVNEGNRYVIDEIQLVAGSIDQERARLKHTLRSQVVNIRKEAQRTRSSTRGASLSSDQNVN